MATAFQTLKEESTRLNYDQRAELAQHLLDSLEPPHERSKEEWNAEIRRRIAEIENGTAKVRPLSEFIAELREKYP